MARRFWQHQHSLPPYESIHSSKNKWRAIHCPPRPCSIRECDISCQDIGARLSWEVIFTSLQILTMVVGLPSCQTLRLKQCRSVGFCIWTEHSEQHHPSFRRCTWNVVMLEEKACLFDLSWCKIGLLAATGHCSMYRTSCYRRRIQPWANSHRLWEGSSDDGEGVFLHCKATQSNIETHFFKYQYIMKYYEFKISFCQHLLSLFRS